MTSLQVYAQELQRLPSILPADLEGKVLDGKVLDPRVTKVRTGKSPLYEDVQQGAWRL